MKFSCVVPKKREELRNSDEMKKKVWNNIKEIADELKPNFLSNAYSFSPQLNEIDDGNRKNHKKRSLKLKIIFSFY